MEVNLRNAVSKVGLRIPRDMATYKLTRIASFLMYIFLLSCSSEYSKEKQIIEKSMQVYGWNQKEFSVQTQLPLRLLSLLPL